MRFAYAGCPKESVLIMRQLCRPRRNLEATFPSATISDIGNFIRERFIRDGIPRDHIGKNVSLRWQREKSDARTLQNSKPFPNILPLSSTSRITSARMQRVSRVRETCDATRLRLIARSLISKLIATLFFCWTLLINDAVCNE